MWGYELLNNIDIYIYIYFFFLYLHYEIGVLPKQIYISQLIIICLVFSTILLIFEPDSQSLLESKPSKDQSCTCKEVVKMDKLHMKEDRMIWKFNKADIGEEEWEEIEETVKQLEISLPDMVHQIKK